jgi:CRISPR-associated endonuclease/helicase Cas3
MSQRIYGHTKSGAPITEEMVEALADEAERGYAPGALRGRRRGPGRPPLGDEAKSVESVRLEPALRAETARRAAEEGITVSEVIRRALRAYLQRPTSP